jgi:hypothetical protein
MLRQVRLLHINPCFWWSGSKPHMCSEAPTPLRLLSKGMEWLSCYPTIPADTPGHCWQHQPAHELCTQLMWYVSSG